MFRTTCASASSHARRASGDQELSWYGTLGVLVASLAVLLITTAMG